MANDNESLQSTLTAALGETLTFGDPPYDRGPIVGVPQDDLENMKSTIEALQAKNARMREATEQTFMEGFGVAAAMTPYLHEVMRGKKAAWLSSRSRAALQQDKEGE